MGKAKNDLNYTEGAIKTYEEAEKIDENFELLNLY